MWKHDTVRFDGYADDIDSLLVFVSKLSQNVHCVILNHSEAGLFSAILTAFVVQTYPMLQVDNTDTTNQLLALGVSTQLGAAGVMAPQAVNATLRALVNTPPFYPSTSIRSVNSLFFLSLVLSIAAAFIGIRAKQWIREYLNWNAPLPSPRENVLVRQVRMEDWDDWNVDAAIACVPALLEVAMVLFLVGVTILLWTLDNIVAIIVTVSVAAFLVVVSAFTVLPVFFVHCPYRSPTAWALVRLLEFICYKVPLYAARAIKHLALWTNMHSLYSVLDSNLNDAQFVVHKSWRNRDLGDRKASPPWWRHGWWLIAAQREIWTENIHMTDGSPKALPHIPSLSLTDIHDTFRDILETSALARALSWAQRANQDFHGTKVDRYVRDSLRTIHSQTTYARATLGHNDHPHSQILLPIWYLLSGAEQPGNYHHSGGIDQRDDSPILQLRRGLCVSVTPAHLGGRTYTVIRRSSNSSHYLNSSFPGLRNVSHILPVVIGILSSDLRYMTETLHILLSPPSSSRSKLLDADQVDISIRRTYELVNALCQLTGLWEADNVSRQSSRSAFPASWSTYLDVQGLRRLLVYEDSDVVREELDVRAPGLRLQAFKLACRLANVSWQSGSQGIHLCSLSRRDRTTYELLLQRC